MMIAEAKPPHPRRLEDRALAGSTHSYHLLTTKRTGAGPGAGDENEVGARVNQRAERSQTGPKHRVEKG
jgi:hypothetical protein